MHAHVKRKNYDAPPNLLDGGAVLAEAVVGDTYLPFTFRLRVIIVEINICELIVRWGFTS